MSKFLDSNNFDFVSDNFVLSPTVPSPPIMSSINYDLLDINGGDTHILLGSHLSSANVIIDFGGAEETFCEVTSNTSSYIAFTSPSGITAGTYDLVIQTINGVSTPISVEIWAPEVELNCIHS